MWLKIDNALVTKYVLLTLPQFFSLELFILVFGVFAIIHQQVVAMLREFMRLFYRDSIVKLVCALAAFLWRKHGKSNNQTTSK